MEEKAEIQDQGVSASTVPAPARNGKTSKLKIAAIVLSILFLLIAGAALFLYSKLLELKEIAAPIAQTYEDSMFDSDQGRLPAIAPMRVSAPAVEASSLTAVVDSKEFLAAAESAQQEIAELPEDAEAVREGKKAILAFAKYADRPIVQDFISAARQDPEFAKAFANKDPKDPAALFAAMQQMKNLQGIMIKFALRKDFMPFVKEVTSDPDIKPMIGRLARTSPRK